MVTFPSFLSGFYCLPDLPGAAVLTVVDKHPQAYLLGHGGEAPHHGLRFVPVVGVFSDQILRPHDVIQEKFLFLSFKRCRHTTSAGGNNQDLCHAFHDISSVACFSKTESGNIYTNPSLGNNIVRSIGCELYTGRRRMGL